MEVNWKSKKVKSECLTSWLQIQKKKKKNHHFEVLSSLILSNNNELFLDLIVTYDKKWILYNNQWQPAQRLDQEAPKHFPKQNLHQKRSWSLFGGLLLIWSTTAVYTIILHLRSMIRKLITPKFATPAASIGQQNGPNFFPWQYLTAHHTTNASKVEQIGLLSFTSSAIFTWLLAKQLPLLQASQNFLQENCFHNHQEAENAF